MRQLIFIIIFLFGLLGLGNFEENYMDDEDSDSSEHGVVATRIRNNCTCGGANKDVTKIVNGTATKRNEYPFIAGLVLLEKDLIQCGGTIVTERHIITAGHCTQEYLPSDYGVFIGHISYVQEKSKVKLLRPKKFFVHEEFDNFTLKYDISVILMKDRLTANSHTIGIACLPTGKLDLKEQKVTLLGWGRESYAGETSGTLLKVKVYVNTTSECKFYNTDFEKVDVHQFCTYRKYKDSCRGDSGGPVLWLDPDTNRYTLVGVTSYGIGCAKYPSVNTDIGYFLPWIQRMIAESYDDLKTCSKVLPKRSNKLKAKTTLTKQQIYDTENEILPKRSNKLKAKTTHTKQQIYNTYLLNNIY